MLCVVLTAEKGPNYFVVFRYAGGAGTTLEVAGEGAGGWDEVCARHHRHCYRHRQTRARLSDMQSDRLCGGVMVCRVVRRRRC